MLNNHLERCVSPLAVRTCSHALRVVWETCLGFSELTIIIFICFRTFMWSGQVCPRNRPHSYKQSEHESHTSQSIQIESGGFEQVLWLANLHSVPFTECVLASLTGVLRSDRRILFVSKCVFQRAGQANQHVSFELAPWLHKRLNLSPPLHWHCKIRLSLLCNWIVGSFPLKPGN